MNTTPEGLERLREDMLTDCQPGPIFVTVYCVICVCFGLLLLPYLIYLAVTDLSKPMSASEHVGPSPWDM
jgi:hypothetical protein